MGDGHADKIDFRRGLERALARIEALQHEIHELENSRHNTSEALAVIGLGCRFPQIENPTELWQFLMHGRDAVREIPANRPELARIAELYPRTRWGSLFESLDGFDARFFGMSPREANWLDPQQRLLLEVCIEALEDAGLALQQLEGTRTGVFVGMIGGPGYEEAARSLHPSELDAYTFTGIAHSIAAGRVAHILGLQGPAMIVDTACSSSLVAIHLACQSLRRGECDQVLAGGVSLIQSPSSAVMAAKVTALSDEGRCRTFDAAANGIARGEGAGVVVLKRLADARAHGDQILAVVKGSAINHDGRAAGLGVPSVLAQTAVLKDALQDAKVSAASIGFVETHGTGTSIGDPIELTALKNVIGAARSNGSQCRLGAIKSNLGHTEAAAGVAGFIKCVLALRHGAIPPNLHFRVLNPRISLAGTPLSIPTEVTPWPAPADAQPRRAGVSSFGMSGTNAHIVLEESAPAADDRAPELSRRYVLPLSAHDASALAQSAGRYAALLEARPETALEDLCFSAGHRRSHYATRLAVTGASREELCAGLRAFAAGSGAPNVVHDAVLPNAPVKVLFVFSGIGSQWPGMGRQLHVSEPSFRVAFDACSAELERLSGKSVMRALLADAHAPSWGDLETNQLLLFAMQVALASLWRSWGVEPDAVLGTSLGEIAAAHVAGALSLSDAATIVHERVRLLQRLVGSGGMLATELSLERATSALGGYEDRVGIAANNSPRSAILSGDTQALTELKRQLDEQGEFCRWVRGATVPGHSPAVDQVTPELREALRRLTPRASDLPFYSSVTCTPLAGASLDADYWARNLREPVAFGPSLGLAIRDGHRVLIEISPHPVLLPSMMQVIAHERAACAALASGRRDQDELPHLTQSLAQLFAQGGAIDFRRCYPSGRALSLPTYPFQRRRFWNDPPIRSIAGLSVGSPSSAGHPLLGARVALSVPGVHVWQRTLRRSASTWLTEHRIAGCEVLPAAAMIEMVAAAARELGSALPIACESVTFHELPMLRFDEHPALQLALTELGAGAYRFRLSQAVASERAGGEPSWRLCVEGRVGRFVADAEPVQTQPSAATDVDVYSVLAAQDTVYGPPLRALSRMRSGANQLWGELSPLAVAADSDDDVLPLSALEACFQAAACARRSWEPYAPALPSWPRAVARLVVRAPLPERGQCAVVAGRSGLDVVLSDSAGNGALTMEGLTLEELDEATMAALRALQPVAAASEPQAQDLLATLQASVDPNERGALTREYLRREIARVSRARPEDISDDLPFLQLGIDSIMGLELRSRLEASFQLELPATVIYSYPDLNALSRFILEASGLAQDATASDDVAVKPAVTERSSWILRPVPRGKQALRLLVFPFSGGTAAAYVQWASRLPDQIEVCAVELPGRGFRFRQPAYEEFFALVDALDRELRDSRDQPFALFGHSMGAMVAFELARRWSADGGAAPQRLFVSGLPAPQWFDTTSLRVALAEDRLLDHLAKWGAVSPAARDQDVLAMGMSAMQSDLRALASWSYREAAPLPCPITALRGTNDPLTPLEPTKAWRQHTQSQFRLVTFPGDHFYFQVERARLLRVLADDLLSTQVLVEQVSHGA